MAPEWPRPTLIRGKELGKACCLEQASRQDKIEVSTLRGLH